MIRLKFIRTDFCHCRVRIDHRRGGKQATICLGRFGGRGLNVDWSGGAK